MRARVWGWRPGRAVRTARVRALPVVLAGLTVLVMAGGGGGGPAAPRTPVAGVLAAADGSSSGPAVVLPRTARPSPGRTCRGRPARRR